MARKSFSSIVSNDPHNFPLAIADSILNKKDFPVGLFGLALQKSHAFSKNNSIMGDRTPLVSRKRKNPEPSPNKKPRAKRVKKGVTLSTPLEDDDIESISESEEDIFNGSLKESKNNEEKLKTVLAKYIKELNTLENTISSLDRKIADKQKLISLVSQKIEDEKNLNKDIASIASSKPYWSKNADGNDFEEKPPAKKKRAPRKPKEEKKEDEKIKEEKK